MRSGRGDRLDLDAGTARQRARPRRWSAPGGGRRRHWRRPCSSPRSRPCPPGRPSSSPRWPGRARRPRRMARRFSSTRSVCSAIPPSTSSPVDGIEPDLAGGEEQSAGAGGLAVGSDRAGGVRGGDEVDRHQNSPSMVPSGWTRIASADGVLLRPGMVMISPASATTKPAPAEGVDVADGEPEAGRAAELGRRRR